MQICRPRKGYLRICILLTVAAFLCYTVGASPYQLEVTYLRKVFSWEDGDEFNDWYATVSTKWKPKVSLKFLSRGPSLVYCQLRFPHVAVHPLGHSVEPSVQGEPALLSV